MLAEANRWEEAIECYGQALAVQADYHDARFNRSLAYLMQGDFERGWPEYETRWLCKTFPSPLRYTQRLLLRRTAERRFPNPDAGSEVLRRAGSREESGSSEYLRTGVSNNFEVVKPPLSGKAASSSMPSRVWAIRLQFVRYIPMAARAAAAACDFCKRKHRCIGCWKNTPERHGGCGE